MGGSNDPSNLVELTIEEHAEAHRKLYEEHNQWQDLVAWKALSGQITSDEIRRLKTILTWTGRKHSATTKKKIQEARALQKSSGWTWTEEARERKSKQQTGKKLSDEHKQAISSGAKGMIQPEYICPHCSYVGKGNAMKRWHFDNCKELI